MKRDDTQKVTSQVWDDLYVNFEKGVPLGIEYPTETLVRYVSNLRKNIKNEKEYFNDMGKERSIKNNFSGNALEFGFGSIANLMMVNKKGFDCYGLEVSQEAVTRGKIFLKQENINNVQLQVWQPNELPYDNDFFALVYGIGCIYYNLELEKVIEKIYRVLKDNGSFLYSFFSTNHGYMQMIEHVSGNIYRWSQNHTNKRLRGAYLRQPQSKQELYELFSVFRDVEVYTWETDELPVFQSFWYVTGKK